LLYLLHIYIASKNTFICIQNYPLIFLNLLSIIGIPNLMIILFVC
jgi:hypothetical protein